MLLLFPALCCSTPQAYVRSCRFPRTRGRPPAVGAPRIVSLLFHAVSSALCVPIRILMHFELARPTPMIRLFRPFCRFPQPAYPGLTPPPPNLSVTPCRLTHQLESLSFSSRILLPALHHCSNGISGSVFSDRSLFADAFFPIFATLL